jgi:hypothetical protein
MPFAAAETKYLRGPRARPYKNRTRDFVLIRVKPCETLFNTSFNENEPIVCTPEEAIDCFQRTRMDVLAIGPFLVLKPKEKGGTLADS